MSELGHELCGRSCGIGLSFGHFDAIDGNASGPLAPKQWRHLVSTLA
jgi:hypothetical protein